MFLAINEILKEKSRFILITIVIILVSYLVFFLTALAFGLATSYTKAIDKWDASSMILSKNANDNISRSLLYENNYIDILSDSTAPLGVGSATIILDEPEDVSLFGMQMNSFLAPTIKAGRSVKEDHEIVVSDELQLAGVEVGSIIELQGGESKYTVVGLSESASFQTAPVIYMTLDAWRTAVSETSGMIGMRDETTISAIVVHTDNTRSYTDDDISQLSIRDFSFSLPGYQAQVLTFSLMIGFLIGIAAFVLAIFIYILTMQKKNVFGVLKAEGVPSSYIGRSVMVQVVILSLFGLLVGMSLAVITGLLLSGKVPFAINPIFFIGISTLFLICTAAGGIASVLSVAKIDPVESIG